MSFPLSEQDRAVVLATLEEIRSEPPPSNRAGQGCVMALPGFLLLLVFPIVGRMMGIQGGAAAVVLILGGVLLVVGLALWFTAGGAERGRATAAAEAALRVLEDRGQDGETYLRAATLLLCNAYATHGPSTVQSFDFGVGASRLGAQRERVMAVEEVLLGEGAIYPVFTSQEPDTEDTGRRAGGDPQP